MSNTATIDTHAFVKQLKASGFTEEQAEAQISIFTQIIELGVATKTDIADLHRDIADVRRDIEELRKETKANMKEMELRMTVRLGSIMVIGIGVIAAIIKLF